MEPGASWIVDQARGGKPESTEQSTEVVSNILKTQERHISSQRHGAGLPEICVQNNSIVVDDEWSTELGAPLNQEAHKHALSVAWLRPDDCPDRLPSGPELRIVKLQLLADLVELLFRNEIAWIVRRLAKPPQHCSSLVQLAFTDQPSRTSWDPGATDDQAQRRQALNAQRKSPGKAAVHCRHKQPLRQ